MINEPPTEVPEGVEMSWSAWGQLEDLDALKKQLQEIERQAAIDRGDFTPTIADDDEGGFAPTEISDLPDFAPTEPAGLDFAPTQPMSLPDQSAIETLHPTLFTDDEMNFDFPKLDK